MDYDEFKNEDNTYTSPKNNKVYNSKKSFICHMSYVNKGQSDISKKAKNAGVRFCQYCNNKYHAWQINKHENTCIQNPKYTKNCVVCNGQFSSNTPTNVCSYSCSNKLRTIVNKGQTKRVQCIFCGVSLEVAKNKFTKTILCDVCKNKKDKEKEKLQRRRTCKVCGTFGNASDCVRPEICKKYQILPTLVMYFGFNHNLIGTTHVYEEYDRIKNLLHQEYWELGNTLSMIAKKYKYTKNVGDFSAILRSLGIKFRTTSEANKLAILLNRTPQNIKSKYFSHGWHTTWEGTNIYYRSSYELDFAQYLDNLKLSYEVEKIRLEYWDTQENEFRIAICDFYLPLYNVVIEVKSSYTLDVINMQDRIAEYRKSGYVPYICYDKQLVIEVDSFLKNHNTVRIDSIMYRHKEKELKKKRTRHGFNQRKSIRHALCQS
jgi:hypothetical protein